MKTNKRKNPLAERMKYGGLLKAGGGLQDPNNQGGLLTATNIADNNDNSGFDFQQAVQFQNSVNQPMVQPSNNGIGVQPPMSSYNPNDAIVPNSLTNPPYAEPNNAMVQPSNNGTGETITPYSNANAISNPMSKQGYPQPHNLTPVDNVPTMTANKNPNTDPVSGLPLDGMKKVDNTPYPNNNKNSVDNTPGSNGNNPRKFLGSPGGYINAGSGADFKAYTAAQRISYATSNPNLSKANKGFGIASGVGAGLSAAMDIAADVVTGIGHGRHDARVEQEWNRRRMMANDPNTNPETAASQQGTNANMAYTKYGGIPKAAFGITANNNSPTMEGEDGEWALTKRGQNEKFVGDKHGNDSDGDGQEGVPTNEAQEVISARLPIGKDVAKVLSAKYRIKLKSSDVYADVMDKVDKKFNISKSKEILEDGEGDSITQASAKANLSRPQQAFGGQSAEELLAAAHDDNFHMQETKKMLGGYDHIDPSISTETLNQHMQSDSRNPLANMIKRKNGGTMPTYKFGGLPQAGNGRISNEGYQALQNFERSKGSPTGGSMGADYDVHQKDAEIDKFIKENIGDDVWEKLPDNVRTQAFSWMFNHGTDNSVLQGLAHAANPDAVTKGKADSDEARRSLSKEDALNIIKKADWSDPKIVKNYTTQVLPAQYQSIADNYDPSKGGFDAGQKIYGATWKNRATDIGEAYDKFSDKANPYFEPSARDNFAKMFYKGDKSKSTDPKQTGFDLGWNKSPFKDDDALAVMKKLKSVGFEPPNGDWSKATADNVQDFIMDYDKKNGNKILEKLYNTYGQTDQGRAAGFKSTGDFRDLDENGRQKFFNDNIYGIRTGLATIFLHPDKDPTKTPDSPKAPDLVTEEEGTTPVNTKFNIKPSGGRLQQNIGNGNYLEELTAMSQLPRRQVMYDTAQIRGDEQALNNTNQQAPIFTQNRNDITSAFRTKLATNTGDPSIKNARDNADYAASLNAFNQVGQNEENANRQIYNQSQQVRNQLLQHKGAATYTANEAYEDKSNQTEANADEMRLRIAGQFENEWGNSRKDNWDYNIKNSLGKNVYGLPGGGIQFDPNSSSYFTFKPRTAVDAELELDETKTKKKVTGPKGTTTTETDAAAV